MHRQILPLATRRIAPPALRVCAAALLCWAAAAWAEPAQGGAHPRDAAGARASFEAFAEDWMERARDRGERDRAQPRARPGSEPLVFTFRAVARGYSTDLQETGRSDTPWVGVLRYTEDTWVCADPKGATCHVAASAPVIEVFRYRDGRWTY